MAVAAARGSLWSSMRIEEVIAAVNAMETAGVIGRYAIGGAVGATFFLEPVATLDVDIFVALEPEPGQVMVSLRPIIDFLVARGGTLQGEYIVVAGWPVQFLPAGTRHHLVKAWATFERQFLGDA